METEQIEKMRISAIGHYKQLGNILSDDFYNGFYSATNQNPVDNCGNPIIVHNYDVLTKGFSYRLCYKNLVHEYHNASGYTIKVGVTTGDSFVMACTDRILLKNKIYNIGGVDCILLDMLSSQQYRDYKHRRTVLDTDFLVASVSDALVNGVRIKKNSIFKIQYLEFKRIKGKTGTTEGHLIFTLPNNKKMRVDFGKIEVSDLTN